jgi:8-oxo-dGTP diphosphatase
MIQYVLGYVFDKDRNRALRVLLLQKNRPEWMAGKYNGIGGKIEPNESAIAAMRRECFEECGLKIDHKDWTPLVQIISGRAYIHVFTALVDSLGQAQSVTDEPVWPFYLDQLPKETIDNVRWMVPMAALVHTGGYSVINNPFIHTQHPQFDAAVA